MLIRARIVLPVHLPPIENGAVLARGGRVAAVGRWPDLKAETPSARVIDLGDRVLLPGLINAHCHLDYTDMGGRLPRTRHFSDWIKAMLAMKGEWGYSEFARSWINGASMLLRSGVTSVLDIESVPELLPEVWDATPLQVVSCLELIHLREPAAAAGIVQQALDRFAALPGARGRCGLSPHALYTTTQSLVRAAAAAARLNGWPLTSHVAESQEESDMVERRSGHLFDWLAKQRDMSDCGATTPVQWMEAAGALGPEFVAAHVNHASEADLRLLARRNVSVVHCPRSHAFFQHHEFPLDRLRALGVNVCVGTDSLASVQAVRGRPPELSLLAELRALSARAPHLPPRVVVEMATLNPARALGRAGHLGELRPGAQADLVALPWGGVGVDPYETVVQHPGAVHASMIKGRWVFKPEGL